jgi:type II secretory pathway component GspD/PulD (secretin)
MGLISYYYREYTISGQALNQKPISQLLAIIGFSVYHTDMIGIGKRPLLAISVIFILPLAILVSLASAEVAIIQVNYREASDLLPMVKTLLSPDGKASLDERTNSIIVVDTSTAIAEIQAFVATMDKPAEQVRVNFRFQETSRSTDRDISTSGRYSDEHGSVAIGGAEENGVHVSARDSISQHRGQTESFILVMSGSPAYLWVGREIPFTQRWFYLTHTYAHEVETVEFQRVETGFEVKPVVAGDRVHIEIVPRISSFDEGAGVVRLTEASTKVTVLRGQWVTIGGTSEQSNEAVRAILSSGSSSSNSTLSLSLMVE